MTPISIAILFLVVFLADSLGKLFPPIWVFLTILVILVLFIGLAVFSGYISKKEWERSKYIITKDKVTVVEQNKTKTYGMKGYTSMRLDKSIVQRFCNSGKITLFFMGGGSVELNNIDDPEKILEKIETIII